MEGYSSASPQNNKEPTQKDQGDVAQKDSSLRRIQELYSAQQRALLKRT